MASKIGAGAVPARQFSSMAVGFDDDLGFEVRGERDLVRSRRLAVTRILHSPLEAFNTDGPPLSSRLHFTPPLPIMHRGASYQHLA